MLKTWRCSLYGVFMSQPHNLCLCLFDIFIFLDFCFLTEWVILVLSAVFFFNRKNGSKCEFSLNQVAVQSKQMLWHVRGAQQRQWSLTKNAHTLVKYPYTKEKTKKKNKMDSLLPPAAWRLPETVCLRPIHSPQQHIEVCGGEAVHKHKQRTTVSSHRLLSRKCVQSSYLFLKSSTESPCTH